MSGSFAKTGVFADDCEYPLDCGISDQIAACRALDRIEQAGARM